MVSGLTIALFATGVVLLMVAVNLWIKGDPE